MKTLQKIILLALLLPQLALAFGEPGRHSRQKQISKAFIVNPEATTEIDNLYGNIYVTTWNEDKVQLDINIKVSGDNEKWVEEKLSSIDVDIKALRNLVSAQTIFENNGKKGSGKNSVDVNYTLHIPAKGSLKLKQKFGNISIPDVFGTSMIDLQYGNLETGNLAGASTIDLQYADKVYLKSVKNSVINTKYSKVTLGNFSTLKVDSGYSDVTAGTGNTLQFNGNYGALNFESVKTIAVEGNYLTLNLASMTGSCQITSNYSKIKIGAKNEWDSMAIQSNYSTIDIGFAQNRGFKLQVDGNYTKADLDDILDIPAKKSGNHFSYNGSYKDGSSAIQVSGNYGSVKLRKL